MPDPSPAGQSVARSIARIKCTIEIARKRGEITLDESNDALALLIFEIYQNQCRYWLAASKPDVQSALLSYGTRSVSSSAVSGQIAPGVVRLEELLN